MPSPPRILIVDDYPDALDVWGLYLSAAGFQVLTAPDGRSAFSQAVQEKPDLIVMDLELHGKSGYEVARVGGAPVSRDALFAADVGITGVTALVAETGSLVIAAGPHELRSTSLLPPVHIAVASSAQIVPDLFDLLEPYGPDHALPSNLVLITGPSKTGDIELKLVTGVHGPGEVHVIVQA